MKQDRMLDDLFAAVETSEFALVCPNCERRQSRECQQCVQCGYDLTGRRPLAYAPQPVLLLEFTRQIENHLFMIEFWGERAVAQQPDATG